MIAQDYLLIEPDWSDPVVYKRRWMTSFLKTLSGGEQRSALFSWPRRGLKFKLQTMSGARSNYLKRRIYNSLEKIWGVPAWQDRTVLTSQAVAGQPNIDVGETDYRNFEVGAPVILFTDEDNYEVGLIDSKTSNSITLKSNLAGTWDENTRIYPLLQGRLKTIQTINLVTAGKGSLTVDLSESFDGDITHYVGDASAWPMYGPYSVFNAGPNWINDFKQEIQHPYENFVHLGKDIAASWWDESKVRVQGGWQRRSRADIWKLIDFFDASMGRWGDFWFPSFQADVIVTAAFDAAATALTIQNIDWTADWSPQHTAGHFIRLFYPDGTEVYRKITRAVGNTIYLDSAVGKAASAADLNWLLVSFLYLGRFEIDELEIEYKTEAIGEAELTFSSLTDVSATTTTTTTTTTSTTTTTAP